MDCYIQSLKRLMQFVFREKDFVQINLGFSSKDLGQCLKNSSWIRLRYVLVALTKVKIEQKVKVLDILYLLKVDFAKNDRTL